MFLAYVDESYTEDWYVIAALLVDGAAAKALTGELNGLVRRIVDSYGFTEDNLELHGFEIFHGKKLWRRVSIPDRVAIFDDVIDAIVDSECHIIVRAMDVAGQKIRYTKPIPPHSVVLQYLLERIDEFATERDDYALVIADEVAEASRYRTNLMEYQSSGTVGYRSSTLARIVDTLHFAPSHESRLVQAVDLIAFLYRRTFSERERNELARQAKVRMWEKLNLVVRHHLCTFPIPTNQHGWGDDVYR